MAMKLSVDYTNSEQRGYSTNVNDAYAEGRQAEVARNHFNKRWQVETWTELPMTITMRRGTETVAISLTPLV